MVKRELPATSVGVVVVKESEEPLPKERSVARKCVSMAAGSLPTTTQGKKSIPALSRAVCTCNASTGGMPVRRTTQKYTREDLSSVLESFHLTSNTFPSSAKI